LPAVEDVAQLFAIEPGAGCTLGGEVDDETIEVADLVGGEFAFVLEQGPAQPLSAGSVFCSMCRILSTAWLA
jgi:hypothetical protein